jgi:hypothetical protein
MSGMLSLEAAIGDASQIGINQWKQFLESFRLAVLPLLKQSSDIAWFSYAKKL